MLVRTKLSLDKALAELKYAEERSSYLEEFRNSVFQKSVEDGKVGVITYDKVTSLFDYRPIAGFEGWSCIKKAQVGGVYKDGLTGYEIDLKKNEKLVAVCVEAGGEKLVYVKQETQGREDRCANVLGPCKENEVGEVSFVENPDYLTFLNYSVVVRVDVGMKNEEVLFARMEKCDEVSGFRDVQMVMMCIDPITGLRGDFDEAKAEYVINVDNGEVKYAEACRDVRGESNSTGETYCLSRCKSQTDCGKGYYCDEGKGFCLKQCDADYQCGQWSSEGGCGIAKRSDGTIDRLVLSCGLKEDSLSWYPLDLRGF